MDDVPETTQQRRYRNRAPLGGALAGIVIIFVGAALLLDNFGFRVWDYAPALLVAFGVLKMVEGQGSPSSLIFGGLLAGGGTLWLLNNLHILRFDAAMIWPVIIIGIGVTMLIRTLEAQRLGGSAWPQVGPDFGAKLASDIRESVHNNIRANVQARTQWGGAANAGDSTIHMFAFFGGSSRRVKTPNFRGGDAFGLFGGIDINLREAGMTEPSAILDVNAIFGGVDIKVPQTWNVTMRAIGIFGGCDDKTDHNPTPGTPELIITGNAIFGGITVKN